MAEYLTLEALRKTSSALFADGGPPVRYGPPGGDKQEGSSCESVHVYVRQFYLSNMSVKKFRLAMPASATLRDTTTALWAWTGDADTKLKILDEHDFEFCRDDVEKKPLTTFSTKCQLNISLKHNNVDRILRRGTGNAVPDEGPANSFTDP